MHKIASFNLDICAKSLSQVAVDGGALFYFSVVPCCKKTSENSQRITQKNYPNVFVTPHVILLYTIISN